MNGDSVRSNLVSYQQPCSYLDLKSGEYMNSLLQFSMQHPSIFSLVITMVGVHYIYVYLNINILCVVSQYLHSLMRSKGTNYMNPMPDKVERDLVTLHYFAQFTESCVY